MKILVFSDSHGNEKPMMLALRKHKDAELIVFCGDGHHDFEDLQRTFPKKTYLAVRGNCDWNCQKPMLLTYTVAGKKLMVSHGHAQYVKEGLSRLIALGHKEQADILLFGHTHSQLTTADSRMLIMNPGSIGFGGQYGIIEIDEPSGRITAIEYPDNEFGPVIISPA
ncbi:MAG: YfcE family phosphodiesterase [Clostridia bacterium]|nr:YfcE family phosphodiesterase [Clostridia bacterium]